MGSEFIWAFDKQRMLSVQWIFKLYTYKKEMWSQKWESVCVGRDVLLLCQALCYSSQDHYVNLTLKSDIIW